MKKFIGLMVGAFMFFGVATASATTMTFEEFGGSTSDRGLVGSYHGFNFGSYASWFDNSHAHTHTHAVVSGDVFLYGKYQHPILFSSTSDFTLNGAYFTSYDNPVVTHVNGYSGTTLVEESVFTITDTPSLITFDWENIDSVSIWGEVSNHDYHYVYVDDVRYNEPIGSQPVPEPCTMLLLGTGLAGLVGLRRKNSKK